MFEFRGGYNLPVESTTDTPRFEHTVAVIGAGKVDQALASLLRKAGANITAVRVRRTEAADAALVRAAAGMPAEVSGEHKALYRAAATVASNHPVALEELPLRYREAYRTLAACAVDIAISPGDIDEATARELQRLLAGERTS